MKPARGGKAAIVDDLGVCIFLNEGGTIDPNLDLGVYIIFSEGDEEMLYHLLQFFVDFFFLSEDDFSEKDIRIVADAHPLAEAEGERTPLKVLIQKFVDGESSIKDFVAIGFRDVLHQTIFREYVKTLEGASELAPLLKIYRAIEGKYFPKRSTQH